MTVESTSQVQPTNWDTIADFYVNRHGRRGDIIRRRVYDPAVSTLLGDTTNQIILDAGSGNGYWTRRLARNARLVVGIDNSEELLKIAAKKNHPKNVLYSQMDLTQRLRIQAGTVDTIVSNLVLDYVPEIDTFAAESARVLRPNGTIVVGVEHPVYRFFRTQNDPNQQPADYYDETPVKRKIFERQVEVTIFNRTLSNYTNTFTNSGFELTGLAEPRYPKKLLRTESQRSLNTIVPRFLLMKFSRKP